MPTHLIIAMAIEFVVGFSCLAFALLPCRAD
mgnify:CR=1 FL=1